VEGTTFRPRTIWQVLLAGVAVEPMLEQLATLDVDHLDEFHAEAVGILESLATPAGQVDAAVVQRWAQTARTLALASVSTMGTAAEGPRNAVEACYARAVQASRATPGSGMTPPVGLRLVSQIEPAPTSAPRGSRFRLYGRVRVQGGGA